MIGPLWTPGVELAVCNIVHGEPVKSTDALAKPEALEHLRDRP